MAEPNLPRARRETTDMEPRVVALLAAATAGMLVFSLVAVLVTFPNTLEGPLYGGPVPRFADPQLQTNPARDMAAFRADEAKTLNGYGWVDRAHGIVHVPIEAAMAKVVAEGIPGWPLP